MSLPQTPFPFDVILSPVITHTRVDTRARWTGFVWLNTLGVTAERYDMLVTLTVT